MFLFDAFLLWIVHLIFPDDNTGGSAKQKADDAMTYIILDELESGRRETDFKEFREDKEPNHHEGCEW